MKIQPAKTIDELLSTLSYIADIEKTKNICHSWRIAILATHIAQDSASKKELKDIFYASLLHDIGATGLIPHIIYYLMRDNKDDRYILLSHPIISAQLVSNIPQMHDAAKLILDHHEWVNGQGYPRAKIGTNIPLGAQTIKIADTIDIALQSNSISSVKELKEKLSPNINKEFSEDLFNLAIYALSQNSLFEQINSPENIPGLLQKAKTLIGPIRISRKIDAIGSTLEVVSQIIDMRHPYNAGHSLRVSRYAMAIAMAMGLAHDEITQIKWSGLIHDIGKFTVSRFIMNKPGNLTPEEYQEIKKHVEATYDILQMIPSLRDLASIAANHHEYYDGSGYPKKLKGLENPLGARILVVCDAFDAMTSNRPYRQPLTPDEACAEIQKLAGKQFDPEIAKIAIPIFKSLGL